MLPSAAPGTIGGTVTVNANGTLAPGVAGTGTLNTAATTLNGTYACQISGANSDRLAASGTLTLTNATLAISTLTPPIASSYVIATFSGATPSFTTVTGLPSRLCGGHRHPGQIKLTNVFLLGRIEGPDRSSPTVASTTTPTATPMTT